MPTNEGGRLECAGYGRGIRRELSKGNLGWILLPSDGLSNTTKKTMRRYAQLNEETGTYLVSGFLIAQIGKNYAVDGGSRITGKELMQLANRELAEIQHRVGGGVEYLDCEADAKLINFYEGEGFRLFGERISEKDGKRYLQYMRFF